MTFASGNDQPPMDAEFVALEQQRAKLAKIKIREESNLIREACRLMAEPRVTLKDIPESMIIRAVLGMMFSQSISERQWAITTLMQLKGMKARPKKENASAEDTEGLKALELLKPDA